MSNLVTFGDPARFEIAVGWLPDREPRECQPSHGGWSSGQLRLTVGNFVLTRHEFNGESRDAVRWYLLPVFEWIAKNWVPLLHEQNFDWRNNSSAPAAPVILYQLHQLIDAYDGPGAEAYAKVREWWSQHALRAADSSALYPDVFIRRLSDNIEISWTGRQPSYSPDGFQLMLAPGAATLSVAEVAKPLWEMLAWVVSCHPSLDTRDRESIAALERQIATLAALDTKSLEAAFLAPGLSDKIGLARADVGLPYNAARLNNVPAVTRTDDAVLMFGGVTPDIGYNDVHRLIQLMAKHRGGTDSDALADLVRTDIPPPLFSPHEQGYELAEEFLDELEISSDDYVNIESVIAKLDIDISHDKVTKTIRGVSIAGAGYKPAIMINTLSPYNCNNSGIRFTMAHELFHIIYDREYARRITHTSGPWAIPSIEKRANAFAAMLLMPRALVRSLVPLNMENIDTQLIRDASCQMQVGTSALVEHLYNLDMIDDLKREELRGGLMQ